MTFEIKFMENLSKPVFITVVILIAGTVMVLLTSCISQRKPVAEDPCAGSNKVHTAVTPVPRQYDYWFADHNAIVERNKHSKVDMIFIGNSITKRWDIQVWNEYFAARNPVNMGFDGDGTQNVLWRLDHGELDGISPKLAVVMIGSNHVNGYTVEEIADGIKAVCCRIRTKLPNTKILLLGILPRGDASAAAAYRLNKASEVASKIVDNRMIYYLNVSERFLDKDGNVSKEMTVVDRVHLSSQGYKTLAEAIEPTISKLMGKR